MRILAIVVLVLAIVPVAEVVERIGGRDHPMETPGEDDPATEHACAALLHVCHCHAPSTAVPDDATVCTLPRASRIVVPEAAVDLGRGSEPPPVPPPIA